MGKQLDRLLGRNLNVSKLKILFNLTTSRLSVLRNQRQARCHLARSDIVQILNLGHHDRALIRVEQVIKEQNMLDVFVMIEGYCNLLAERISLLKQEKVCPEELRESVSGILYASTRCGEFPELIEMRAIFTSRFGREFAASAIELRNNCSVNPKMIQKLSTRQPILEDRLKVLKEIANDNNIVLKFEEDYSIATEENMKKQQNEHQSKPEEGSHKLTEEIKKMEEMSDSIKMRRKYKDVADAAQAAFESAAYAAAAARVAVELSKSENYDPDDQNTPRSGKRRVRNDIDTQISEVQPAKQSSFDTIKDHTVEKEFEKTELMQNYDTESEDGEIQCDNGAGESAGSIFNSNEGILFDKSDDENGNGESEVMLSKTNNLGLGLGLGLNSSFATKEDTESIHLDTVMDRSQKRFPLKSEAGAKTGPGSEFHSANLKKESKIKYLEEKRPVSVRTRLRTWKH